MAALWIGMGITASGLEKLGANVGELPPGPGRDAFAAGMAARSAQTGDTGESDPARWHVAFQARGGIDAVLIVAADQVEQLDETIAELGELVTQHDGSVVFQERGQTLAEEMRGREHFGFKDGASQPAIAGYDADPASNEPPAVPAGEFVLGYADTAGTGAELTPLWRNGSFLVFRRLAQNVVGFRTMISTPVPGADPAITPDQLGAKAMGRWKSGAPLEKYPSDPGPGHVDNDFGFQADDAGVTVPTWAHIRKANPRDETQPTPTDDPSKHRMLRRGIPFGPVLPGDSPQDDGAERGLHFIAVVADVARQFEFVQASWINNANFPKGEKQPGQGGGYNPPSPGVPGDGPDPVVGEGNGGKQLQLHQPSGTRQITLVGDVVKVTGGEYFFCPSTEALKALGS